MFRILFLGLSLLTVILLMGCGSSNPVIATIGNDKITLHEYENNFAKYNGGWDSSKTSSIESREKFLDLILRQKLKVKEAYSLGLDKDPAIISEVDNYKFSAAQTYIIDNELVKPAVEKMYERKKEEVRISHILVRFPAAAKPADTLAAYERAMKVLAMLPQVPFDTLAYKYSEDTTARKNYGDLGFEASGRTLPEFEDAYFVLKPGEYTKKPIRTFYGYHILKATGRRPSIGSIRLSAIFLKFNDSMSDTAAVRDTIWMLYRRLKNGESFEDLASKYSKNIRAAENKGDIGTYNLGQMNPMLSDLFYALQKDSITEPMQFKRGYQIFKETERNSIPSFAEIQKDLKLQYQRMRYQNEFYRYLQDLKGRYQVAIDSAVARKLISSIDTAKTTSDRNWKDTLTSDMLKKALVLSRDHFYTIEKFAGKISSMGDKHETITPSWMWSQIGKFAEDAALEEHARRNLSRYPELEQLFRDYEEGTLLYRIEQDEVWKKVLVNDSLLREYYDANKEKYSWPDRVNFAEIYTLADSTAKEAYWMLRYGEDFKEVANKYTNRSGYKEKNGEWGLQPISLNDLSRKASTMAIDSISEPIRFEGGWSIIKMLGRDNPCVKSFEEAMPEVASEYQDVASKQREQQWVEELQKKYPVTTNKELLPEAFKRKRVETQ
jgi:peptidyl-prolyl cis-trans isomerase SurA